MNIYYMLIFFMNIKFSFWLFFFRIIFIIFRRIILYILYTTSTMTTSSEDVLMQVGQVRYKKGDGTLYVMNERIAWMLDNRDTVSVSHKYADIKCKKICIICQILLNKKIIEENSFCYKFTTFFCFQHNNILIIYLYLFNVNNVIRYIILLDIY